MGARRHCYDYPLPAVAADVVVTATVDGTPRVLLIRRGNEPCCGQWAVPGGFVDVGVGFGPGDQGESLEAAAARELREETGVDAEREGVALEQLHTFGTPGRDPRGRVISVVYLARVQPSVMSRTRAGDDAAEARWFDLDTVAREGVDGQPLAFDHARVLAVAIDRLMG